MKLHNLTSIAESLRTVDTMVTQGRILKASGGLILEASLPKVAVGTACEIQTNDGRTVAAEVVGFHGSTALLVPFGETAGVCEGCSVTPRATAGEIPVGDALLGRVVNARMEPIDGGPAMALPHQVPLHASPPRAMLRRRISKIMPTGVKCIDVCLTLAEGQRLAVAAGPGVGKSVLLGMIAKHAVADVIVVGLIGERGREVREFVERDLGASGLKKSVIVVSTGDEPPLVRVRAALAATAVAEFYRRQNKRVILLMDSLSRVAMAAREIGLAAGEPPTTKGYPPSVFALIPKLVERAGMDEGNGSITALYTVLAEGDDLSDPVTDCARAALDGHIILSRKLAGSGHFPAVDVLASVSRCMNDVASSEHHQLTHDIRDVMSTYQEAADLIEVGAYQAGSNPKVDRAIKTIGPVRAVLRQQPDEHVSLPAAVQLFKSALGHK